MTTAGTPAAGGRTHWLALIAVLVLAFNLRPVAVSVGPVLTDISADLGLTGTTAGLLTSLPSVCFAVFGALTPEISRRLGMHYTVGLALAALIAGQLARAWVTSGWAFLLLSILALAGMATCNILLPSLVRHHFPLKVGLATSLYSLTLSIGVTAASIGTVPLANALGGWRAAFTAGIAIAVAAAICWIPMLRHNAGRHGRTRSTEHVGFGSVARTRMGWVMAVFFGLQSTHAYTIFGWLPTVYMDAGMSQFDAGLMLGIATGVGIVPAFMVPRYAARVAEPVSLFLVIMAFLAAGFIGLLVDPMTLPWLWSVFLALGTSSFPLILALLGLRSRTPSGTTALSGFTQSLGYTIAAFGPLLFGALGGVTGSWTLSLSIQLALVVPMTIAGYFACRRWYIEDEVRPERA
ncbi:MFS transporter [Tessaracoccus sp. OS52]|uniref:CynX/NimT family MFS transporter n=1 Tax=Tessaracoccus sp. OS52 TaxID=2886691 RepID=UPI001D11B7F9|nr:MFS transporter [Tessaracoccus sp. OS52]MCC2592592.1 MFS transporter [Tessaracoccus sp. OS52]